MTDHLTDTITLLDELIAYPTVSADSNLGMIASLANRLEDHGAQIELQSDATGQKANLFATFGPERPGGILLSGHSDVVPAAGDDWTDDPFKMVQRDGRLYGRGTCDMKGFIAAATTMAPVLGAAARNRPIHLAFTYDEEVGCMGGQALAALLATREAKPAVAIIGEPTEMRIIEGHKGCNEYTTHFSGLAGHGSDPAQGVNAVEYAVRYVSRLLELRHDLIARAPAQGRFTPSWTTLNVGSVYGGVAHNVIADHAQVQWEIRPVQNSDADFVHDAMTRHVEDVLLPAMRSVASDAAIVTETIGEIAGLTPTNANEARDIIMELTGANACDLVAFGTEAGLFQKIGMDVVVCGPGSIEQAHKPDEYLEIAQLARCLDMLEGMGAKL
ncbi:acetylornithine deacetylase [Loktanella agnita]|uniref:acetylornithine deacetylase n=1 Tax=Loktanella agnita TaxID=287097 RepID=UPI0039895051